LTGLDQSTIQEVARALRLSVITLRAQQFHTTAATRDLDLARSAGEHLAGGAALVAPAKPGFEQF
jgi:hypothetical protein